MSNKANFRFFQLMSMLLLLTIHLAGTVSNAAQAPNNPLEITNIKPAGMGSPAISSTNRIFKAYPGIEYNIRPAVIGGFYPYLFSLKNQPAGMTIDTQTGVISWPNPQSDSGLITLSVKDSKGNSVSTNWSITVSTNGFIFVNSNYTGNIETGTISQPYKSISSFINSVTQSSREYIVYFRGGNYSLPIFQPSYFLNMGCNLSASGYLKPYKWIGYPGELANINASGHYIESGPIYFDNLTFTDFVEFGIRTASGANYNTVRRCDFNGLTGTRTSNDNQGFYFTEYIGVGNYHVIQDNKFHHYTGAVGIGSLYYNNKILIENNHIYDFTGNSPNGASAAIGYKANLTNGTIRGNIIELGNNSDATLGSSMNSNFYDSTNTEICFNLFNVGASRVAHRFNIDGFRSHAQGLTYYYRNTVIGDIVFQNIDGANCSAAATSGGPWYFYDNVIINPTTAAYTKVDHLTYHYTSINTPQNCINDTTNLKGLPTDNIIDVSGKLIGVFKTNNYGKNGHQTGLVAYPPN